MPDSRVPDAPGKEASAAGRSRRAAEASEPGRERRAARTPVTATRAAAHIPEAAAARSRTQAPVQSGPAREARKAREAREAREVLRGVRVSPTGRTRGLRRTSDGSRRGGREAGLAGVGRVDRRCGRRCGRICGARRNSRLFGSGFRSTERRGRAGSRVLWRDGRRCRRRRRRSGLATRSDALAVPRRLVQIDGRTHRCRLGRPQGETRLRE